MLAQTKKIVAITRKNVMNQRLAGNTLKEIMVKARLVKVRTTLDQNIFLVDILPPQFKDPGEHLIIYRTVSRGGRKLWGWPLDLCWFFRESLTEVDKVHTDP